LDTLKGVYRKTVMDDESGGKGGGGDDEGGEGVLTSRPVEVRKVARPVVAVGREYRQ
jgi:hypothetical protein